MLADETERLFFPSLIIFALDACIFLKFFNICFKLKFMIFSKSGFLWNLRKWLLNIKLGTQKFNIIVCCDSMSYLGIEYYGFVYSDIQSSLLLLLLFFHTFCYLLFTYYTCSLFIHSEDLWFDYVDLLLNIISCLPPLLMLSLCPLI